MGGPAMSFSSSLSKDTVRSTYVLLPGFNSCIMLCKISSQNLEQNLIKTYV